MEKRIITISREFGSGGRTIGKLVAEHLGIRCYDAELIQKLASESGFDENYIKEAGEYTPGGFLASAFTNRSFGPTNEDLLWKLQYRIIRELAEKEPCVIVGRCADFILQDRTDCLKVFVHADMKFRADRIVRVYGEREKSPEARLKEKDKRRAAYYRFYTDMNWGNAANYHIALDSGIIGIEKSAEIIESLSYAVISGSLRADSAKRRPPAFRYAGERQFLSMAVLWKNQSSSPWYLPTIFKYPFGSPFRIKSA